MLTCLRGPQGRLVLPIGSPSQNKEFTYLLTYLEKNAISDAPIWLPNAGLIISGLQWDGDVIYEQRH